MKALHDDADYTNISIVYLNIPELDRYQINLVMSFTFFFPPFFCVITARADGVEMATFFVVCVIIVNSVGGRMQMLFGIYDNHQPSKQMQ